jgi:hypothetical protein
MPREPRHLALARALRRSRRRRRWSLAKAAAWFGVSLTTYWRWEAGKTIPVCHRALLVEAFAHGVVRCPTCGGRVTARRMRTHGHRRTR